MLLISLVAICWFFSNHARAATIALKRVSGSYGKHLVLHFSTEMGEVLLRDENGVALALTAYSNAMEKAVDAIYQGKLTSMEVGNRPLQNWRLLSPLFRRAMNHYLQHVDTEAHKQTVQRILSGPYFKKNPSPISYRKFVEVFYESWLKHHLRNQIILVFAQSGTHELPLVTNDVRYPVNSYFAGRSMSLSRVAVAKTPGTLLIDMN